MRLKDKVALVTGGTSGIGRRIVQRFRDGGAEVVFTGRRATLGEQVARETGAAFVEADAGSEDDAARIVRHVLDGHGRIDVLVNNAGGPAPRGRIEDLPLDGFDRTMQVHVRGALAHIKHAAPAMRAAGRGSIVNIGSVAGHRAGYSTSIIYGVAKAAVIHLTRLAAMELGKDGVRVNSVSPGFIATGIFGKAMGLDAEAAERSAEKARALLDKAQAIPRAGRAEDIANAVLYLASDEAGFVNGEDLVVDGGLIWGRRFSEVAKGGGQWASLLE